MGREEGVLDADEGDWETIRDYDSSQVGIRNWLILLGNRTPGYLRAWQMEWAIETTVLGALKKDIGMESHFVVGRCNAVTFTP